ncbi:hypothetical protein ACOA8Y_002356 [Serratia marcescens]|uniref:Uncharacterized protein n=1 Tax=Serratia marcescens TaxID=615 RepID=A0AAP8PRS1_SERMA|nr:hypothetical protein [Serratia marcescens]MBH3235743.1 hypothetical protein [Serratia marcescens]POP14728.1 hypothetical protein C3R40_24015 [Serratia marcescens]
MLNDGQGVDLSMMTAVMHMDLRKDEFPYFVDMFYRAGVINCIHFLLPARRVYETCRGVVKIDAPVWLARSNGRKSFDEHAVYLLHDVNKVSVKNFRQYVLVLWLAGVSAYSVDVISRQVTYYSDVDEVVPKFNGAARSIHR